MSRAGRSTGHHARSVGRCSAVASLDAGADQPAEADDDARTRWL